MERSALLAEVEHEAALRGGNGQGGVAAGLEVAVGETNGRLGEEGDVVVDEGVDVEGVDRVFGAVVVDGGIAEGVGRLSWKVTGTSVS